MRNDPEFELVEMVETASTGQVFSVFSGPVRDGERTNGRLLVIR